LVGGSLVLAACSKEASPSIVDPKGHEARHVAGAWWLMFGLAAAVYAVVAGLIVIAVVRGRRDDSERTSRLNDNAFIVIGGLAVPLAILGIISVVTVRTAVTVREPAPAGALRVDIIGHDWWWEIRYPDTGIVTANELHVPVGRRVDAKIHTADVIHSFWVPQITGKMDAIPGQANRLPFTAEQAGVYRGECAEFCGIQHANMNFLVVAEEPTRFAQWEQTEAQAAGLPMSDQGERGRVVFEREACAGCHTIRGTSAAGSLGPDLTHVGGRRTLGAGTVPNTTGNLAGWIADAQAIKPGNKMPPMVLSPDDLLALVRYLQEQK
jgi:cytochrome c oxidase subunit 2